MFNNKLKRIKSIFSPRGAVIDKGAIYVVVILTILIFGGFIFVGGTLPTKLPKASSELVALVVSPPEPTTASLQLHTFYGVTSTPRPQQPTLAPESDSDPVLIDCRRDITGSSEPQMIWGFTFDAASSSLRAFYTNKNALVLGSGAVTQMGSHPASQVANPSIGNAGAKDSDNLPLYPAIFITDITNLPQNISGDSQGGGQANKPGALYGTWKANGTADPEANGQERGPGASTWPPANGPQGIHGEDFTTEIVWTTASIQARDPSTGQFVSLQPGHKYRIQIVLHDGASPSDVGQACMQFNMPGDAPPPQSQANSCDVSSTNPLAVPAFPCAQGGGAEAKGGRGGRAIEVTNLNDSGTGSLRACVEASGPRTCVFRVGGTINLSSTLGITNSFLTVAGQTAPGGGITLSGKSMGENVFLLRGANNVIVRYIRVRKGQHSSCGGSNQCGSNVRMNKDAHTAIFDHLSLSWNQDEGINPHVNTTISHSLICCGFNTHPTGILSDSGASGVNEDIHHNLVMNNSHRNPLLRNKSSRVVNNIWYNQRSYVTHVSGGMQLDNIGNKYKRGPLTGNSTWHEVGAFSGYSGLSAPGMPSVYMSGNVGWHQPNPAGDQWAMVNQIGGENGPDTGPMPTSWRRSSPMPNTAYPVIAEPVGNIEASILPIVGASRRLDCNGNWVANRDSLDTSLINQYQTNTGIGALPQNESGYGGYPSIANGTPCADADHDGMPDQWETAKGFNPNDPSDGPTIAANGYSNLENYINGL